MKVMAPPNQADVIRELLKAVQEMRQIPQPVNPNPIVPVIEQFRRYSPPTFDGGNGPLAVEEWLQAIEKIFKHIACPEFKKVGCAEFMLIGRAGFWWESASRTRSEEQQAALTWDDFKEEIRDKFFPQALRDHKETEFLRLVQGDMDIVEYERRFEELSRYAPHLVETEFKKARRFERGLRSDVRQIVSSHELPTYREVVKKAQAVAYAGGRTVSQGPQYEQRNLGKRKWQGPSRNQNQNRNQPFVKRPNPGPTGRQMPNIISPCPKCQRMHKGECLFGKGVCYKCGQSGHFATDCRAQPAQGSHQRMNPDQNRKGKARVFAMDAAEDSDVIAGILVTLVPLYMS
jgi:hypothetical protein